MSYRLLHVHASCRNVGDHVLVGILRRALTDRLPGATFVSASRRPGDRLGDEPFVERERLRLGRPLDEVRDVLAGVDAVVVGGGDLLTGRQAFSLYRSLITSGLPIAFVGVGVNLSNVPKRLHRISLKGLSRARIVTRDAASAAALREAGLSRVVEGPDLAMLEFVPERFVPRAPAGPEDSTGFDLAVSVRWPEANTARWGDAFYDALAIALDRLIIQDGARVSFVSMTRPVTGTPVDQDDAAIAELVQDRMTRSDRTRVLTLADDPGSALDVLGSFDVIAGLRLHALALATLRGVAPVPFDYSPKIRAWWRSLQNERDALAASAWTDPDRLVAAIRAGRRRTPAEIQATREALVAQRARLGAILDEVATSLTREIETPGRRFRTWPYRVATHVREPARDRLERAVTRLGR